MDLRVGTAVRGLRTLIQTFEEEAIIISSKDINIASGFEIILA